MDKDELLDKLADECGYDSVEEMLDACVVDCSVPGACRACGAIRDSVEPDASNYECEECGVRAVDSALVIAGVM